MKFEKDFPKVICLMWLIFMISLAITNVGTTSTPLYSGWDLPFKVGIFMLIPICLGYFAGISKDK